MDTPPSRIGRFEILRELGRGMMGVVYEAHDPVLHRTIALKVIRLTFAASEKEREAFERRFMTEARAAAGLSHPGIVVVHEVGRDAETGLPYLALEHLPGTTLAERIATGGPVEKQEALRLVLRVAEALHYAHGRGVVHRDIKPANVMVLPGGEPKILDFGLAKLEAGHEQTAAGQFLGTPLFMSPEQALGQAVDGRSDLFSLGAILYTLLAGRRPFEGESVTRILARVAHQPPSPLREAAPSVSADTEYVVMRALQKDPARRYATGAAMAEDIADVLAGRSPRHRADLSPAPGEGTVVARAEVGEELPELALEPASSRPRRRFPLRALSLTLLLGGLALYYLSISGPERLAEVAALLLVPPMVAPPATLPRGEVTPPDATVTPSPEPTASPAEPTEPAAVASAEPAASPSPSPSPLTESAVPNDDSETSPTSGSLEPSSDEVAPVVLPDAEEVVPEVSVPVSPSPWAPAPAARPSPTVLASPRPSAELAIHLEHPLTKGTVRAWLDGKLVFRAALSSVVTKKILFFTFRGGHVRETLRVGAGEHLLRVEVRGEGRADSGQASVDFKPGARRQLFVRPGSSRGKLSFQWR